MAGYVAGQQVDVPGMLVEFRLMRAPPAGMREQGGRSMPLTAHELAAITARAQTAAKRAAGSRSPPLTTPVGTVPRAARQQHRPRASPARSR